MRHTASIAGILGVVLLFSGCSNEEPAPEPLAEPETLVRTEPEFDPQQRGSAQQWLTMIRWMQKKQNLWQFDPATEEKIITYLAENYPPSDAQRRAALPRDLMPPNPYSSE
jgi:PBP1b-binding outer membrane lipoprotein LpoB